MNLKLDWQKKAIILFAAIVLILSVILTVLAIREAEREKLVRQTEINQELERIAVSINAQVIASIQETEDRVFRFLSSAQNKLSDSQLADVATRIKESESLIAEIFFVGRSGRVSFPLFKTLYRLNGESAYSNTGSIKIEDNQLFRSAETAEFKTRNYSLAISNYRQLLRSTSDKTSRALLLNRIARSYMLSEWEWAIYSIDPQTNKVEPIIPPEEDSDVYGHCWSKSGNSIYYLRVKGIAEGSTILNNRIIHHNFETGREREIGTFQSINSTHELFCISPDGKKLAFVQRDTDQDIDIINVIPVTGGDLKKVCILDLNKYIIRELAWTPDGCFILFSSMDRSEDKCELMRISAEGGEPEKLGISKYGISYVSIHPDGRKIAFSAHGSTQRPPEIWVMENFLPKEK